MQIKRERGFIFMELKQLAEKMKDLNEACRNVLAANEEEMITFLRKDNVTAEECLQKEILFELLDNIHGVQHMLKYMGSDVTREGLLGRDEKGEITFDGEILPLMTEVEVYAYDEELEQEIWTRGYVGGSRKRFLVGLDRDLELIGMKARMRG